MLGRRKKGVSQRRAAANAPEEDYESSSPERMEAADRRGNNEDYVEEEEEDEYQPPTARRGGRRGEDPDGYRHSHHQQDSRASYLMGGSGISLDGRSLVVPMDREFDDVSSINTFGYTNEMRVLGTVEPEDNAQNRRAMARDHEGPIDGSSPKYDKRNAAYEFHSARPSKEEKTLATVESYEQGCLPLWITDSPIWLKVVVVVSTALLVGAIVLIGVGAALAVQKNRTANAAQGGVPAAPSYPGAPTLPPVAPPTVVMGGGGGGTPTAGSNAGSHSPVVSLPTDGSSNKKAPTSPPARTNTPTVPGATFTPTSSPSSSPTLSAVTFYVTAGRFTGSALTQLPDELATLPQVDGNEVLFQLGDWNSAYSTSCDQNSYQVNADLYSHSSVPVYFILGGNEYNDCPQPTQALAYWKEYLLDYETKFWPAPDDWNVTRQEPNYPENFAYVYNRILFIGIDLVGGTVLNNRDWKNREDADLQWIDDQYNLHQGEFDVMVVLGHSDPAIQANAYFFQNFYNNVKNNYKLQVIFINQNLTGATWGLTPKYNGINNLMHVVVEGSAWPPMLVQIDTRAGTVQIDQGQWYSQYMSNLTRS